MDTQAETMIDTMMSEIRERDREAQIEAMRKYVYFTFDWPPDFVKKVWGNDSDLARHFVRKLEQTGYDINKFFGELSKPNQHRLLSWILDNFEG